ncbi:hypothetical protein B0H10DRAFT_2206965 [Mycena sp. CBHHK59/15]|nr:hypothetical protein B0H10DRAFT_2206965 [Mycena sp. CBHHK59/15]
MATTMRRPPSDLAGSSRAAQRKQRLLELENEQRLEDLEALKMTEEQRLSLFHSFRSVKFEWSDLDGMRSVRRRYNVRFANAFPLGPSPAPTPAHNHNHPRAPRPTSNSRHSRRPSAVLNDARLATLNADDTICLRTHHSAPASPSPYSASPQTPFPQTPTPGPYACSNRNPYGASHPRRAARPSRGFSSPRPRLRPPPQLPPVRLPTSTSPRAALQHRLGRDKMRGGRRGGWEDEDEDATVSGDNDERGEEGEDESALPTAVAPRSWRFADALALDVGATSTLLPPPRLLPRTSPPPLQRGGREAQAVISHPAPNLLHGA